MCQLEPNVTLLCGSKLKHLKFQCAAPYKTLWILGFIEFEDKYDAEDAIKDLDDTKLCGERVKLELSKVPKNQSSTGSNSNVYIYFRAAKINIAISVHLVAFDIEVLVAKCLHHAVVTDHAHHRDAVAEVVIDPEADRVVEVAVADEAVDVMT